MCDNLSLLKFLEAPTWSSTDNNANEECVKKNCATLNKNLLVIFKLLIKEKKRFCRIQVKNLCKSVKHKTKEFLKLLKTT